jgi:hypothetical protein
MGKPITMVNKMAESVLTQEPRCQQSNTGPVPVIVAGQICNCLQEQSPGLGSVNLGYLRDCQKLLRSPNRT